MPAFSTLSRLLFVLLLGGTLAACDTAEERAQGHYDRAMTLIADGEVEKAIIEFRNVFKLNGKLVEARLDYADLMLTKGDIREAIAHFNLVIEQQPGNLKARRELARLMLEGQQWDIAELHLLLALDLAPDDLQLLGFKASLDYRNEDKRQDAVASARRILAADPTQLSARLVIITMFVDAGDNDEALGEIDKALAYSPDILQLHLLRLVTLERIGDDATVGIQLANMVRQFPRNLELSQAKVRWHMSRNDLKAAEQAMRDLAATDPSNVALAMEVVSFLEREQGLEAARVELIRLSESGINTSTYRRALALFDYKLGNTEEAFAAANAILADGGSDQEIEDAVLLIARLHFEAGNLKDALQMVDENLAKDNTNVTGLILRAEIAIANETPEGAILDLRSALNQNSGNPRILSLLAKAHIRNGSNDLARDRLAQAMEASRGGPAESMAYANFLVAEENLSVAEDVMVASLRNQPANTQLLQGLADLRLRRGNWDGAREIAARLREVDPDGMELSAEAIEVSSLSGQQRFGESIARIEAVLKRDSNDRALAALIQLYLQSGQPQKAESTLRDAITNDASDATAQMLLGAVLDAEGRGSEAELVYRALISSQPEIAQPYVLLFGLLSASGRVQEAGDVLDAGAKSTNGAPRVEIARAAHKEITGDFETAIEIYSALYEASPNSLILANNLASLLSEHRTDIESQDRAFRVARRFRNSDVPAFQDTYGWILYRRGDFARALIPLQSAVEGLPDNPLVAFHYGMTIAELGQTEDAIEMLERAVALAGDATNLPQIPEALARIDALKAGLVE